MGWTYYDAPVQYRNGHPYIDRKAECDKLFNWQNEHKSVKVVKSAMIGSTYYAAVQTSMYDIPVDICAVIVLTKTDCKSDWNFGCKSMDETMLPYYFSCPNSILKLLTPTTNEYALKWRESCKRHNFDMARKRCLVNLPVGSKIRFQLEHNMSSGEQKGEEITLTKIERPNGKTMWYRHGYRWAPKYINSNYQIVEDGVCDSSN